MELTKKGKEWRVEVPSWKSKNWDRSDFNEMRTWCMEHYGPGGRNKGVWRFGWVSHSSVAAYYFYFKNEHDATFFILRWGV